MVSVALGGVVLAASLLYFLQTRDPALSILGLLVAIGVAVLGWVWQDARRTGLPTWPWLVVVLLAPVVGLGAYLVAREIRRSSASS